MKDSKRVPCMVPPSMNWIILYINMDHAAVGPGIGVSHSGALAETARLTLILSAHSIKAKNPSNLSKNQAIQLKNIVFSFNLFTALCWSLMYAQKWWYVSHGAVSWNQACRDSVTRFPLCCLCTILCWLCCINRFITSTFTTRRPNLFISCMVEN